MIRIKISTDGNNDHVVAAAKWFMGLVAPRDNGTFQDNLVSYVAVDFDKEKNEAGFPVSAILSFQPTPIRK